MVVLNLVLALFLSYTNPVNVTSKPLVETVACDAKQYRDKCVKNIPEGWTFLKSYTLDGRNGARKQVEYSYIFSKNTTYLVVLANNDSRTKGLKVTLYDSNRKQLASSFVKERYYPAVAYKCNATGIYFMRFTFENPKDYCAASVLAFKR